MIMTKSRTASDTPMMRQYNRIKKEHPDAILLFRLGDFYEMFSDDAKTASKVLGLTLTSRSKGPDAVPMCGMPYHARQTYIARLLRAGYKVAICEQMEDPSTAKGLVRREVVRKITRGTILESDMLDEAANNYIAACCKINDSWSLAYLDCSTGEFVVTEPGTWTDFLSELENIGPSELVFSSDMDSKSEPVKSLAAKFERNNAGFEFAPSWWFGIQNATEELMEHFHVSTLGGFGIENKPSCIASAGALLRFIRTERLLDLKHVLSINLKADSKRMELDETSIRNLELFVTITGQKDNTLYSILNRTCTASGARMLRKWLSHPLIDLDAINERLDAVEEFVNQPGISRHIRDDLRSMRDLERLCARLGAGMGRPADCAAIRQSLAIIPELKKTVTKLDSPLIGNAITAVEKIEELVDFLQKALADDPPASPGKGDIIRTGYNAEIDELRQAAALGKNWILDLQVRLREQTGIANLKIKHNRVFGYCIEVSRARVAGVPENWERRQTLVNGERYTNAELRDLENKILSSRERLEILEKQHFDQLRDRLIESIEYIQSAARGTALLDVLCSFAESAARSGYTRPEIVQEEVLKITAGRHPVVEQVAGRDSYIPNDIDLDSQSNRLLIITGPNMAGKSTFIRQAALITIMAQAGSLVPADKAVIGVADKIFTRVGASDNLSLGLSTFMVEMTETANILRNATRKSLVILDEIGRGTSTYDGVAIAWAVAEHLHREETGAGRVLFATHYHELQELEQLYEGIRNYNVRVREYDDRIVFLRQVVPGGSDRSYGIQVAQLAGVPSAVIKRAKQIIGQLEKEIHIKADKSMHEVLPDQMDLFRPADDSLIIELAELDVDSMTPIQALIKLKEIVDRSKEKV